MLHSHRISHVIYGDLNGQTWSRYHASDSMGRKAVLIRYHPKRTDFDDEDAEADRRLTSMNRLENVCAFACRQFVEKILFILHKEEPEAENRSASEERWSSRWSNVLPIIIWSLRWWRWKIYRLLRLWIYVCLYETCVCLCIYWNYKKKQWPYRQTLFYMYTYVQTKTLRWFILLC